jgi:dolichyl-phosphate-mannose-protein mannosyltransferase
LNGEPPTEWVHPPTSKLLIAIGVHLFGYHPWAWRLAPALAGTALAGVFLLLARRVLRSERAAVLATTLLLCDGVFLVQSRIAMTNVFAVLFQLLAALLVLRSRRAGRASLPPASWASSSWRCASAGGASRRASPQPSQLARSHARRRSSSLPSR